MAKDAIKTIRKLWDTFLSNNSSLFVCCCLFVFVLGVGVGGQPARQTYSRAIVAGGKAELLPRVDAVVFT